MEVSLVENLAKSYKFSEERFSPEIEEEYVLLTGRMVGQIDIPYLCRKDRVSHKKVRADIQTTFGKQTFEVEERENEVSKQLFLEHYEFGLYPNVREWIGFIYAATGKLLTRKALFRYLTEDNIDQRWETQPNVSFV